jgi:heme-degrading monooxygenase HmoA
MPLEAPVTMAFFPSSGSTGEELTDLERCRGLSRRNKEAGGMYARIARYRIPIDHFGEVVEAFREVVEEVQNIEGNKGGYLLVDPDNSTALSVTFWDNRVAMEGSEVRATRLRSEAIETLEGDVQSVDRCEVALDFSQQVGV